jgi:2-(1,2-epoxy-1,2-dihydrophenyl)acetyl-CoA isomerase
MNSSIQLLITGGIAKIVLNRPESGNALNLEMAQALLEASLACENNESVRAVILMGAGKAFCLGGDLQCMNDAGSDVTRYLNELTTNLHAAITCFTRMAAPVLAVVNGTAAGAGLGLVAMADLAIAAKSAKFISAYTTVALTPDAGVSFLLPRAIGRKRAMDMMITNRLLTAEQALEWGLVNEVAPDEQLGEIAQCRAEELAGRSTRAIGAVKSLLGSADPGLETHLALEGRGVARAAGTDEAREAVRAFLSRRRQPKVSE